MQIVQPDSNSVAPTHTQAEIVITLARQKQTECCCLTTGQLSLILGIILAVGVALIAVGVSTDIIPLSHTLVIATLVATVTSIALLLYACCQRRRAMQAAMRELNDNDNNNIKGKDSVASIPGSTGVQLLV